MSKQRPSNTAASVRQKLLNLARERGEEFQFVLTRYAIERVLYRLSRSAHADRFVLKGAMLFELWTGQTHRSTLDVDLLSEASDDVNRLVTVFREVVAAEVEDDGLVIDPASVRGEQIREDQHYQGVRLTATATLAGARIPLQIDIGFGDAVVPGPQQAEYPTLLGSSSPKLRVYPKETVVAEKFEAMVSLGIANSRMKDFYDLYVLSERFDFDGDLLAHAIEATFARRRTALPKSVPLGLTEAFAADASKAKQWTAFVKRGRLRVTVPPLTEVLKRLYTFLWPPAEAARERRKLGSHWRHDSAAWS
jgi:predicted nucleotidyltransferase component of viral defense system